MIGVKFNFSTNNLMKENTLVWVFLPTWDLKNFEIHYKDIGRPNYFYKILVLFSHGFFKLVFKNCFLFFNLKPIFKNKFQKS